MKLILPFFLLILLLTSCPKISNQPNYNLGETIMLSLNEPIQIASEGITLIFTEVKESRCPKDVNCIRAGEADLNIDFAVKNEVTNVNLRTEGLCMEENGKCGSKGFAQGYTVQLYFLYPYPTSDAKDRKYAAKVMVTK